MLLMKLTLKLLRILSLKFTAHKTLLLGTKVTVINLVNHQRVKVRITDRGPFVKGRIIDLSKKAARRIDMINDGVAQVELKYKKKR
jgi:rare lipoprotein A